jgi:DNA-binding beta-propeller fold protein YncE
MAEMNDGTSAYKTRNYKNIVSRTREIRDPDLERNRIYTALTISRNGSLLAADSKYKEICIFNSNGKLVKTFSVDFFEDEDILGIAELSDGNIAVCGYDSDIVKVFTLNGDFVEKFPLEFELPDDELWSMPYGMVVNKDGRVFVVSSSDTKVIVFNEKGEFQYSFDCEVDSHVHDLTGVCIGSDGLLYVTYYESNEVLVFQENGPFVHSFSSGPENYPMGIAATKDGHLVVASSSESKLSIFTTSGECVHEVQDIEITMEDPTGIAVDNNGFIYVADSSSGVISVF